MFKTFVDNKNAEVTVAIIAANINHQTVDNHQLAQDIVNEFNVNNADGAMKNKVIIDVEEKPHAINANVYQLKDTIFILQSIILKHTHIDTITVCPLGQLGQVICAFLIPIIGLQTYNRILTSPQKFKGFDK